MNEYKELIEELRNGYVLHENYNGEPEIIHRPSPTDKEAAAAIEQLVKERDGWMIAYDGAQRAYHEWFAEAQKLMKERDALSEYISGLDCSNCGMRGMQE